MKEQKATGNIIDVRVSWNRSTQVHHQCLIGLDAIVFSQFSIQYILLFNLQNLCHSPSLSFYLHRMNSETSNFFESTVHSSNSTSTLAKDPFEVFESTSAPANTSSPVFSDPLEEISKISNPRNSSSFSSRAFDDMDLLNGFTKSMPTFSSNKSYSGKNGSSLIDEPAEQQNDLEFFFHKVAPPSSVPRPEATSLVRTIIMKNVGNFELFATTNGLCFLLPDICFNTLFLIYSSMTEEPLK